EVLDLFENRLFLRPARQRMQGRELYNDFLLKTLDFLNQFNRGNLRFLDLCSCQIFDSAFYLFRCSPFPVWRKAVDASPLDIEPMRRAFEITIVQFPVIPKI